MNTVDKNLFEKEVEKVTGHIVDVSDKVPHAIEIIESVFDDIFKIAEDVIDYEKKLFIYGGAVRDLIANVPLEGDLDIIARSNNDLDKLFSYLRLSSRWLLKEKSSCYSKASSIKFINSAGKIVDLVYSDDTTIAYKVNNTDLLCCCFVMDFDGRIYETAQGAVEDCINKIIRLNPKSTDLKKESILKHIEKLVKRGWSSKIDEKEFDELIEKKTKTHKGEPTLKHTGSFEEVAVTTNYLMPCSGTVSYTTYPFAEHS